MRILYVVNNADFFCSHRLDLGLEIRNRGHSIALLTGMSSSADRECVAKQKLMAEGIDHYVARFKSGGLSLFFELRGFFDLLFIMNRWKPDLVHCVSPKGALYGGLAARILGVKAIVFAISGMGWLFAGNSSYLSSILRWVYLTLLRLAMKHPNCKVIVQNSEDQSLIIGKCSMPADQIITLPGSGVRVEQFQDIQLNFKQPIVILPARVIVEKGVQEFVVAAQMLRAKGIGWRFALVGGADYDNPSIISPATIQGWTQGGYIEWWGYRADMVEVYRYASIVCLPSYREGMPKSLLEAAAAGCAVITTDVSGCREAIEPGKTGDLVRLKDAEDLCNKIENLILDTNRRIAYGRAGQTMALNKFNLNLIISRTIKIYENLGFKI